MRKTRLSLAEKWGQKNFATNRLFEIAVQMPEREEVEQEETEGTETNRPPFCVPEGQSRRSVPLEIFQYHEPTPSRQLLHERNATVNLLGAFRKPVPYSILRYAIIDLLRRPRIPDK